MKQTNLDKLNEHLFEAIEMLKNNSDPDASPNEKIDIETAKAIKELGKVIVDGYKVKANVLGLLSKTSFNSEKNFDKVKAIAEGMGIKEESK